MNCQIQPELLQSPCKLHKLEETPSDEVRYKVGSGSDKAQSPLSGDSTIPPLQRSASGMGCSTQIQVRRSHTSISKISVQKKHSKTHLEMQSKLSLTAFIQWGKRTRDKEINLCQRLRRLANIRSQAPRETARKQLSLQQPA